MRELPILYSPAMVRSLLADTKTQTRRLPNASVELMPNGAWHVFNDGGGIHNASDADIASFLVDTWRYEVGDRLYVREAWRVARAYDDCSPAKSHKGKPVILPGATVVYDADGEQREGAGKFRQGMHMPRWASRLTLDVTGVKAERLQEISEADAIAEGIGRRLVMCNDGIERNLWFGVPHAGQDRSPVEAYADLWDSINNPHGYCAEDEPKGWDANPWVVATTFAVHRGNIDALKEAAVAGALAYSAIITDPAPK